VSRWRSDGIAASIAAAAAALIAASRFKTMIYLIKPHFCIVSRAFVVIRPAIIPARPLHPLARNSDRHDHDSPLSSPPPLLTPFPFPFSLPSRTESAARTVLLVPFALLAAKGAFLLSFSPLFFSFSFFFVSRA